MTTKDYSLLRAFDLEAAKRGEPFVFVEYGQLKDRELIAGPDSDGNIIVQDEDGRFGLSSAHHYNMAPLAWVEGKPVYNGEKMWRKDGQWTYAHEIVGKTQQEGDGLGVLLQVTEQGTTWSENLTWTPPKVKREGWVMIVESYHGERHTLGPFETQQQAEDSRLIVTRRIACVRIEWEEPATTGGAA